MKKQNVWQSKYALKNNQNILHLLDGQHLPKVLYEIPIIKSRRKTTSLKVLDDGSAKIMAPFYASSETIEKLIFDNFSWLIKNSKIKEEKYKKSNVSFVDGEVIFFLGYRYQLKVVKSKEKRVLWKPSTLLAKAEIASLTSLNPLSENENTIDDFLSINKIENLKNRFKLKTYLDAPIGEVLVLTPNLNDEYVKNLIISEYKKTTEKVTKLLYKVYESKLNVKADKYIIKKYKARFGQCEAKKKIISLNTYIAMKPLICIELVLAHEISHLAVFNHSKDFKNILNSLISNYKIREYMLKHHPSPNYLL